MALNLTEVTRTMILNRLKANLPAALNAVDADRSDYKVTTPDPKDYFIYENAQAYRTPAVFLIANNFNFNKREKGANYIAGVIEFTCAAVIEERIADLLTIKADRYQAALHETLDEETLVSSDNEVKAYILVTSASYSPVYTPDSSSYQGAFRKEVVLTLEVEHYEKVKTT